MSTAPFDSNDVGGQGTSTCENSIEGTSPLPTELARSLISCCGSSDGPSNGLGRCGFEELAGAIKQGRLKKNLVRSIIACVDIPSCDAVSYYLRDLVSRQWHSGGPGFVAFCAHATGGPKPHVHVWHDCILLQGNCRCAFLKPFKGGRTDFGGSLLTAKSSGHRRHFRSIPTQELKEETSRGFENILR